MNKDKKLINTLTALSEEITVRNIEERHLKNGKTCFDMYVEHVVHYTPCSCGSKMIKKHGTKPAWAMHVPQGKRSITRIHYDRQRFKCKSCGATFLEDISWMHNGSHLTVSLFDCIASDVRTLMTKNDIARVNAVTVHFVDYVLEELKPPIPSQLPEVICIDETFSQVEEVLNEKTSWVRFVTNLSNGQTGELLDILPFRNKKNLVRYFNKNFTYHNRCNVKHLCCDGADYYISLAENAFGIHSFDYFRTRALLIAGSPGVSRNRKKPFNTSLDCTSFFFEEAPSLKDYVLAYDWTVSAK